MRGQSLLGQKKMTGEISNLHRRIKISTAAEEGDMSVAWVWNAIKNDPECPKPSYDEKGMARLMAHEWVAYLAKKFSRPHGTRVVRMQGGAEKLSAYRARGGKSERRVA
jgi:hypothetical protein